MIVKIHSCENNHFPVTLLLMVKRYAIPNPKTTQVLSAQSPDSSDTPIIIGKSSLASAKDVEPVAFHVRTHLWI